MSFLHLRKIPYAMRVKLCRLRYALGKRLGDTRYILKLTDPGKLYQGDPPPGVEISFHDRIETVPEGVIAEIEAAMGTRNYRPTLERQFASGARLCLATVEGRLGSLGWTKAGRNIEKWQIPLEPDDVVVSRAFTVPAMRGQRLHALVLAARCRDAGAPRYFADCHIHNPASLRALIRSGWSIVGKVTLR